MVIILELGSQFSGFSGRRWRKKEKIKIETQVKLVKEYSIVEMSGMGEIDAREIALDIRGFKILLMGLQERGKGWFSAGNVSAPTSRVSFSFKLLSTIIFILQLQFLRCFSL
ncbi:unnamed protein product [Prunus brigantina]